MVRGKLNDNASMSFSISWHLPISKGRTSTQNGPSRFTRNIDRPADSIVSVGASTEAAMHEQPNDPSARAREGANQGRPGEPANVGFANLFCSIAETANAPNPAPEEAKIDVNWARLNGEPSSW